MITTEGLKLLLQNMPEMPAVSVRDGEVVTLSADDFKVAAVTLPSGEVVDCLVVDASYIEKD